MGNGAGELKVKVIRGCTCFWWFSKTTKREINAFGFFYLMDHFVLILLGPLFMLLFAFSSFLPGNGVGGWVWTKDIASFFLSMLINFHRLEFSRGVTLCFYKQVALLHNQIICLLKSHPRITGFSLSLHDALCLYLCISNSTV